MNTLATGVAPSTLWRAARGVLSDSLASPAARQRLDAAISRLPPALSAHQLLLECDPARDRLDFAIVPAGEPTDWARQFSFGSTLERIAAHAAWALADSTESSLPPHDVWIEYDVAREPTAPAAQPSGFFGLPRGVAVNRAAVARLAALLASDGDRVIAATEAASWAEAFDHALAPLLAAQPVQVVRYLGRMDARGGGTIRYHLGPVDPAAVARWRAYPGAIDPALLLADWLVLGVDLDRSGAGPRWGIELVCRSKTRVGGRYQPMLDALVKSGVLPPEIPDAVARWTGATCDANAADAWLPRLLGGAGAFYCVRTLNHIKLVFTPAAPPTAKVYLAIDRRWLQRGVSAHS